VIYVAVIQKQHRYAIPLPKHKRLIQISVRKYVTRWFEVGGKKHRNTEITLVKY